MIQVGLLGPVQVLVDGVPHAVRGARRTAVLAALALHPGQLIGLGRLVDIVWGEVPSPSPVSTLRSHVSFLRRVLGEPDVLVARSSGYVLDIGDEGTDVQVAERMIGQAVGSPELSGQEALLRDALALWRGQPLGELADLAWFDAQARRLEDLRARVRELLIDTQLQLGRHAELVPDLEMLARERPHHEPTHRQLMLALYRTGRQSDALAAYQRLRHTLDEDLGLSPGQPLRGLELAILRQDAELDAFHEHREQPVDQWAAQTGTELFELDNRARPTLVVPDRAEPVTAVAAMLPMDVPDFVGRHAQLAALDALADAAPRTAAVAALSGTAGVGKTALALHWAHRIAGRFPDGQLHINLRGFDPGSPPLDPAEALRGLLDALAVPAEQIPAGLDARTSLYRSLLAGRKVLVVLDNARDVDQVRPLLPATSGCVTVVTSRNRLTGLIAGQGARPVVLDVLTHSEAEQMLVGRIGTDRAAAEPDAVAEIIARCARLPLAVAIVAARAATHPQFPLATLATEVSEAAQSLDAFHTGDATADLRGVFSWSYQNLNADAARLFRLLGLHPGPDITASAAASLAALPVPDSRRLLTDLAHAHLLTEHSPGRYLFHDLLRAYATEQAQTHDTVERRDEATRRALDHYLATAHAAATILKPERDPIDLIAPRPGVTPERIDNHADALQWYSNERPVLLRAVEHAVERGLRTHTWQLAWSLKTYLYRAGYWQEQVTAERAALAAADLLEDLTARAVAALSLAEACERLDQWADAETYYRHSVAAHSTLGNRSGEADAYLGLSELACHQDRLTDALELARCAHDRFRQAGDRTGVGIALNSIGWCQAQLGDYPQALNHCREALAIAQELSLRETQAGIWDSLGHIHLGRHQHREAADCYRHAIDINREIRHEHHLADNLTSLGDVHHAAGDRDAAQAAWQLALDILDRISPANGTPVREKLSK
jgi:DNA-binding SARP family transcriptional activator